MDESVGPNFGAVVGVVELFEGELPFDADEEVEEVFVVLADVVDVGAEAEDVTDKDAPPGEIPCPYPCRASPVAPTAVTARSTAPLLPTFSLPICKLGLQNYQYLEYQNLVIFNKRQISTAEWLSNKETLMGVAERA